jgi:hypothetical protein
MLAPPRIEYAAFSVPKHGNREEENEDAHWPRCLNAHPEPRFRCAVADGATAAAFSGEWAGQLVSAFGEGKLPQVSDAHLAGLRSTWNETYRNAAGLPWYMEEKVLRGSFAAFMGLEIRPPLGKLRTGRWRAVVVGDCCLFSVRRDSVRVRFPYTTAAQFGDHPYLIATNASPEAPLDGQRQLTWGRWRAGDTFYLMSDAVAAWFLHGIRQGQRPWRRLNPALAESAAFERFVAALRQSGEMKNDDVTVARVMVS